MCRLVLFKMSTSARRVSPKAAASSLRLKMPSMRLNAGSMTLSPGGFDRGLIHEAGIEVADLLGLGRPGRGVRGGGLQQLIDALGGELGQNGRAAVAAAIGGNFRGFDPAAVGVGIEIIARDDFRIHAGEIRTVHLCRGDTGQQEQA